MASSDPSCAPNEPCADIEQPSAVVHNPLDPSTFVFPELHQSTTIIIEFCDRCRWLHRSSWFQTELLLTFPPPIIECISLLPRNTDETAGRFRVWLSEKSTLSSDAKVHLLWDRKVEGGFPELKVLKQRVRDKLQPEKSLGHSDIKSKH